MLFVDVGNTSVKIWDSEGNRLNEVKNEGTVLISSVNQRKLKEFLSSHNFNRIFIVNIEKIPLSVVYEGKVGMDRIVVSLPLLGEKCYIVDAGSMITVDKLDKFTLYPGPIIPGYNIIKENVFKKIEGINPNSPDGTLQNLEKGICSIIQCTVDMFIKEDLPVYITGGSLVCFEDERYIIRENLMFEGLKLCGVNGWYKDLE